MIFAVLATAAMAIAGVRYMRLHQRFTRLERAQIAYGRLNSVEEFLNHPQLQARDRWREVKSPVGPLRALIPPLTMEGVEPAMGDVPALGQHTDAVLKELGFDADTITTWRKGKVI